MPGFWSAGLCEANGSRASDGWERTCSLAAVAERFKSLVPLTSFSVSISDVSARIPFNDEGVMN